MFRILKISFSRCSAEKTRHDIIVSWRNFTLSHSLLKGHVNAKTRRFFSLTAIALICVLSLQLAACGSATTTRGPGQTPPQITSPTPTSEATQAPTPTPSPTPIPSPTPTPTQAPTPTPSPTPTLIPSDPTAFVVHEDGGSLSFPTNGSFAPQPIHLNNDSNTGNKNCCAPLSWSAKVDPGGSWLSLSQYSDSLPAGANRNIFVHVPIAGLCSEMYIGTVTFTSPQKADGSLHSVEIDLDLTSTPSVPPCVTPTPSPSAGSTST